MDNGNAFKAFLAETAVLLNSLAVTAYYAAPLPDEVDEQMWGICGRFQQISADERRQFLDALSHDQQNLFGIFGHRAATLAARSEDPAWLRAGLVGSLISNAVTPPRRNEAHSLAVYHHVARRLGLAPALVFAETAVLAPDDLAQRLIAFGEQGNVLLRKYGWVEKKTPDGIRYKFNGL